MKKIRNILIKLSQKYKPFGSFLRHLIISKKYIIYLYYYFKYKTDDKLVVFSSYQGASFSDSPKALYLEMLNDKKYKNYKFVWVFKDVEANKKYFNTFRDTILVKDGKNAYKYFSMAKYIIVNSVFNEEVKKKKNQIFVQCWHGTPLKKLRYDIKYDSNKIRTMKDIRRMNDIDIRRFDYFISPSHFCTKVFSSAFNLNNLFKKSIIIETGYPRNDGLFDVSKSYIDKKRKELKIPKDKKVILYAPTFRDNDYSADGFSYNLALDFDNLKKEFGSKYVILFRTHYYISSKIDLSKYKGFVIDVSNYNENNDLYLVSDVLITDYSSVFFDFANLKKPIIFYMYDLDLYKGKLRDFYFDLKTLPGPIVKTEEELIRSINNINMYYDLYNNKYKSFNKKFNYLDGRGSSKKVLDIIMKEE